MSNLTITTVPGFDHRDDPSWGRGARGFSILFTLTSRTTALPWSIRLEVSTGWMARPIADDLGALGRRRPLPRRHRPGLDGVEHRCDPSGVVYMCVPADEKTGTVPDYFERDDPWDCPFLGVPCKAHRGYLVGDDALQALLEHGEDGLEKWLRDCAQAWLNPPAPAEVSAAAEGSGGGQ